MTARTSKTPSANEGISQAKLAANRENARLSTGPKIAEGKSRFSRNSFKHGLHSKLLVLPREDPAELDQLRADLRAEHQPINTTEEILVNELAEQYWRLRRFRFYEVMAWTSPDLLPRFQRAMASAERGFHKALATLRQLQKERGFVPSLSEQAPAKSRPESDSDAEATNASEPPETSAEKPSRPAPPPPIDYAERLRESLSKTVGFEVGKSLRKGRTSAP